MLGFALPAFLDDAVLCQMAPMRVAQGAERRIDVAEVSLDFRQRMKCRRVAQIVADAQQRCRRYARTEVIENQTAYRVSRA